MYYKDGIKEEQAKKTADLFDMAIKSANPESSGRKSFQLTKTTDTVQLKMVADKDKLAKIDNDASLYAILYLVSDSVFSGGPVNLVLTDDSFKGFQTITYKKSAAPEEELSEKATSHNIEVYGKNTGIELSQDLANFLDNEMNPEDRISFLLEKSENGSYTIKMETTAENAGNVTDESLATMSQKISAGVLSGAPLVFELIDKQMNLLKTYNYKPE